ncbi:MAG TPA: sulfate ABC transporter permease subunit [Isosphaeraceae bacterium]|jgi:sulfate transport system permease protein|nr:sulfate ABC transporter permease subunit [Isosphaeraceae bacterium]
MAVDAPPRPAVVPVRRSLPIGRWLLIGSVLVWFGLMILVPAVELVRRGLAEGLGPLAKALTTPECVRAFGMTLAITAAATAINTVFGVGCALVLERQCFRGRAMADGLVDLPFAVSPVVAGLMLVVMYGPAGFVGRWVEASGLRVIYAWPGMVLATTFVTIPFVVRELAPVLREFGIEQEQAAATLGAGSWRTFWRVTFPTIRWALAYGVTLTVARSLGEFGALLVVSGNLFGRTQTATLYVHDAVESFDLPGAYAASIVLAAVSVLLLVGMEALRRRVATHEDPEEV